MASAREEESRCPNSASSSPTIGKSIRDIPPDVINEILLSMDVKTLCRLRCVSRWWNAHISSPNFCLLHYHRSLHRGWLRLFQVHGKRSQVKSFEYEYAFSFTDLVRLGNRILCSFNYPEKITLEMDSSSCFGLICIIISKAFYIYNPTTRSIVVDLPPFNYSLTNPKLALGFVRSTNKFKVVSFCRSLGSANNLCNGSSVDCRVLTIPEDLDKGWRTVPDPPPFVFLPNLAVASSESAVYALNLFGWALFRFDLETERWSSVKLPPSVKMFDNIWEFKGSLCILVTESALQDEIWLLRDGNTWEKKWAMNKSSLRSLLYPLHHDEERGRILMMTLYGLLMFYQIEAGTFEEVNTFCEQLRGRNPHHNIPYVETFASLATLRDFGMSKH